MLTSPSGEVIVVVIELLSNTEVVSFPFKLMVLVCPVKLIQATRDKVVDPRSVDTIFKGIESEDKSVHMVDADRHGIVTEDLGGTHDAIIDFFGSLRAGRETARPGHQAPREAARATDG